MIILLSLDDPKLRYFLPVDQVDACATEKGGKHCLSAMDSELEAFSRYLTDGMS
jgi:hypothetical protein